MLSEDPKKHIRFSMLKFDYQEPTERLAHQKKTSAARRLLILAIVCVGTAIILGIVALVVGLLMKKDTRKPISETDKNLQSESTVEASPLPPSSSTPLMLSPPPTHLPSLTTPPSSSWPSLLLPSSSLESSSASAFSVLSSTLSITHLPIIATSSVSEQWTDSTTIKIKDIESSAMIIESSVPVDEESDSSVWTIQRIESTIPFVETTDSAFTIDVSTPPVIATSYPEFSSTPNIVDISASSVQTEMMSTVLPSITTTAPLLPSCKPTEYQCGGGECIPKSQICDQATNCMDQSDEQFCANCTGFQCGTGLCLWDGFRHQCDGIFHCPDLSDEKNCPLRAGNRRCENGVQIARVQWCDGVDNCFDNSDETSCPCVNGRYTCPDGSCILREWVCDGFVDCQNGTDEEGCSSCMADHFVCSDYSCLNQSQVCDGNYSCPGKDDETNCFQLPDNSTEPLRVRFKNGTYLVCADHWTSSLSHFVCQEQSQTLQSSSLIPSSNDSVEVLTLRANQTFNPGIQPLLEKFDQRLPCLSQHLVSVSCKMQDCGEKKASVLTPFVAGGSAVREGKWPWVAALTYRGQYRCTGAVIGRRWIVTAGHCVARPGSYNYSTTAYHFEIVLGTTHRTLNSSSPHSQRLRAARALTHPDLLLTGAGVLDWDVALLQTTSDIRYTDYVQPVCLPSAGGEGEVLSSAMLCYVAGWGWLFSPQSVITETLRDAKMQLWSTERCSKNTVVGETEVNTNSTLCAGYLMGLPTACPGDSGGPLMCQKSPRGRWHLAGVVSSGSNECGQLSPRIRANRFARISSVVNWIDSTMTQN